MKEQFLKELGELLEKYNANIHFDCEHFERVKGEKMIVRVNNKEVFSNVGFWLELDE